MRFIRRRPRLGEASGARAAGFFSLDRMADLPEPVRRYLRHAIAPGAPLARIVRLEMDGSMRPRPGGQRVALAADEILAPHVGFRWTARAHMFGLPVRVRDQYVENEGRLGVTVLGVIPVVRETGTDVTRSSRGRLVAEAVWCPTALVGPDVRWEGVDADRARFTLTVDGYGIPVTIRVGRDGALREVTLERWGAVDVPKPQLIPYGFEVHEEATFGGVTIPVRVRGGWWYGTERFDQEESAEFLIRTVSFGDAS